MIVRCFLDTNVLLYAAAGRRDDPGKNRRALELLDREEFGLSAQVLQEFFVNVVRKPAVPLSVADAFEWIERLAVFPCVAIDANLVKLAISVAERHRINYWDAAIVAAAERLGAQVIYSEDFNHGQTYGAIRVENPFRMIS
jgi:predicted nucleic acid-binding protein